jgi:hypothetical protein
VGKSRTECEKAMLDVKLALQASIEGMYERLEVHLKPFLHACASYSME